MLGRVWWTLVRNLPRQQERTLPPRKAIANPRLESPSRKRAKKETPPPQFLNLNKLPLQLPGSPASRPPSQCQSPLHSHQTQHRREKKFPRPLLVSPRKSSLHHQNQVSEEGKKELLNQKYQQRTPLSFLHSIWRLEMYIFKPLVKEN